MTDLEKLKAALAKATPGEWEGMVLRNAPSLAEATLNEFVTNATGMNEFGVIQSKDGGLIAMIAVTKETLDEDDANARLMVALRNAAPAIIAELEAARAKIERDTREACAKVADNEAAAWLNKNEISGTAKQVAQRIAAALRALAAQKKEKNNDWD